MNGYKPTLLLILDGWGQAPAGPGNAVAQARTPNLNRLLKRWPSTSLACSGRAVGLPDGFMGNSEVGHMNIGAGRIVYQDMTRIDMAVEDRSLFENPALVELMEATKARGGRLHFLGLLSDGGVHSHQKHLYALVEMALGRGLEDVFVHAFLDGRDTPPTSGMGYVKDFRDARRRIGGGRIATLMGRYYAMDRDTRWERTKVAWDALVHGVGERCEGPLRGLRDAYVAGETDEFVKPRIIDDVDGVIRDGDGVFLFNFRADRVRQITRAFFSEEFDGFERGEVPQLAGLASMTRYESSFPLPVAFPPQKLDGCLGEVVSGLGLRQLRIAETEKYAHVTYFLNCGREEPFPGEERRMIASPRDVATYDLKPEMSAMEVTEQLLALLPDYDLCVCNLANLDMVGHSGIIEATVRATETVDACAGRLADAMLALGGRVLLTADHGNAEEMLDQDGAPQTAHSHNPVPLVLMEEGREARTLKPGKLGDIAPTLLRLWGVTPPEGMDGENLVAEEAS
ncbi:MAG: 2,3-bisphosphoglycerate-independent phosphoglycerate mutase [Desulfovibrio sp.]